MTGRHLRRGDGVNDGVLRTDVAGVVSHVTMAGQDSNAGVRKGVGQDDTGVRGLLARSQEGSLLGEVGTATALDAPRDPVKDLHAIDRVFADRGLSTQHDGIGLLEDGIGDISDLGTGRNRILDHRLEHMSGDDDLLADLESGLENLALDDGQLLHGALDTKITTGDHDGIGLLDDLGDQFDGALILDLRNDTGLAVMQGKNPAHLDDVGGLTAEAEGDKIDANLRADGDVSKILLGERWEIDLHAGEIDVATGSELAGGQDLATDAAVDLGENLEVDDTVIDKHHIPFVDIIDEAVVVDIDGVEFLAADTADGELHDVANLEVELCGKVARTDGRSLGVEQDANRHIELGGDAADGRNDLAYPIMLSMAHVEAEDVGSREDHLA